MGQRADLHLAICGIRVVDFLSLCIRQEAILYQSPVQPGLVSPCRCDFRPVGLAPALIRW